MENDIRFGSLANRPLAEAIFQYIKDNCCVSSYKIKQELEDLAFKYEHPQKYEEIMALVNQSAAHREKVVEEFVAPIREKLDAAGFKYEIKARIKSAYSIYNKMETKKIPFSEIYDVYAVRVIFENDDDSQERLR